MDSQVTKGKRGRPKGSKNKSKNDNTSILHKSFGSFEDNTNTEQSALRQMQSFRNSILEHLKVELFGEGNDSVLPTPPMNLSSLLPPTDTHLESSYSSSTKMVSNLGLKAPAAERSNGVSNALNKSAIEMQPRKRGRPRLSEAQKKNKNKNQSIESEKSNHVQDTTCTTVTNQPISEAEVNKEIPLFNHISSSQNKEPNIKKNIADQSLPPNKDCNDVNNKTPEQPLQCLMSPDEQNEQNLNVEKEHSEMSPLLPKLMAVEEVLQGLRLSQTNISCQLKEGEDGSILAEIFTKDCMKSSLKASTRSKLLNSDKVLSSFSSFCKRRMVRKKLQRNESKILLENLSGYNNATSAQKNSFILNQASNNSVLEKENIMRVNNGSCKIMNDAASRCQRSLTRDKLIAEPPELRSTGVQCNERKDVVSVKSQTKFISYKDVSIQTDADLRESRRTSDVSVRATSSQDISLCSKCRGALEAVAKEYGSTQSEIPPKPAPMLSSSFFNNLNLTNFNGLISNPSVLEDTANNKDLTFNLRSSFFDSTFLNGLVTGTPTSKVSRECHSIASKVNNDRVVCFPEDIGIPSSAGINGKLLSANFLDCHDDQGKDVTGSLLLETTSTIVESAGAATEATRLKEKDDFLVTDDVIIRGNIASSTNPGESASDEQANVGTFLDEGFINELSTDAQLTDQSLRSEQDEKHLAVLQFRNSHVDGRSRKRKRFIDDDGDDDGDDFVLRKQSKRICSLPDGSYGHASRKLDNERKYRDCKRFVGEKAKLKSPVYKKIRRCTYVDAKPICKDYEPTSCDCKVAHPDDPKETCCGDSCLNRLVYTECHPSTCPTGDRCSNRRIQKKQWVEGLIKFQTKDRGYGVKTLKSLRPGQFIIEYCGEVVSENEFKRRMSQNYCNERHHYCLNLDSGMVIDGYRMGNVSRFINHSCQPNCVMEKWNINGVYRMGLFALETIKSGDELTYDYNFHAYNVRSQQICKCGSENCRGMMAGKNQKIKKNEKSKQTSLRKHSLRKVRPGYLKNSPASLRPMTVNIHASSATASSVSSKTASSTKERIFAQKQRLFLQRNVKKVMKMRSNSKAMKKFNNSGLHHPNRKEEGIAKDYGCFLKSLPGFENMFSFTKKQCFRAPNDRAKESTLTHIFTTIINTLSDVDANSLYANRPSLNGLILPKDPTFVATAQEPLSLEAILNNVHLSHYTSFQDFNEDINKLLDHIQKREVFNADVEDALLDVKRVYKEASKDVISLYSDIVLKPLAPLKPRMPLVRDIEPTREEHPIEVDATNNSFSADSRDVEDAEVEVIRCVCNIYKDEGLMIQCEKCEKWQHCMCMNVKGDEDRYTCELCSPRPISKEVLLVPQPEDALAHCRYYMTLMRDDYLQVRVGECAYVTREGSTIDIMAFNNQRSSHLIRDQLDIFRVERLWRKYSGDGFAFGHYYMRPHETFHEPNRKFYSNEVFRAPLYHVVPLEAIVGTCCVMDPVTYCKGHPLGTKTEDIYVCEFRVDKAARLFSRINKSQHMINTNSYCFHHYPTKLKPKRTYMVHQENHGGGLNGQS